MIPVLAILLGVAADAGPPAYYDNRPVTIHFGEAPTETEELQRRLERAAEGKVRRIYRVRADGERKEVDVDELDDAECLAALQLVLMEAHGAESDRVVTDLAGRRVPVSVWLQDGKELWIQRGAPLEEPATAQLTAAAVQERYGLVSLVEVDRTWDAPAMALLDAALSRLSPEELALVRDVPFHRKAKTEIPLPALARFESYASAIYAHNKEGFRIEVYDSALEPSAFFVGSPEAPQSQALMIVLHELAHAIAGEERRRLEAELREGEARQREMSRRAQADSDALNARIAAYNANHGGDDPVAMRAEGDRINAAIDENNALVAHLKGVDMRLAKMTTTRRARELVQRLDGGLAPTEYGRTDPDEAFADCFALFHLDPAALLRTAPQAHAWFASGAHLKPE